MSTHPGWTVTRVAGVEVFTAPDGQQYVRTKDQQHAALTVLSRTPGIGPLYLRPRSAEQILKAQARKQLRLARRAQRRIVAKMEDV